LENAHLQALPVQSLQTERTQPKNAAQKAKAVKAKAAAKKEKAKAEKAEKAKAAKGQADAVATQLGHTGGTGAAAAAVQQPEAPGDNHETINQAFASIEKMSGGGSGSHASSSAQVAGNRFD